MGLRYTTFRYLCVLVFSVLGPLLGLCDKAGATVIGNIDIVSPSQILGWACDTGQNASILVYVFAGITGKSPYTVVTAADADDSNEPAVNQVCGDTGQHRFHVNFTPQMIQQFGGMPVSVQGISLTGGNNNSIGGSGQFDFPTDDRVVKGFIDGVTTQVDGIHVAGWACQYGVSESIPVHLYLGGPAGTGTFVTAGTANMSNEPAVDAQCGTTKVNHRFNIVVSKTVALGYVSQAVYVHGIHVVGSFTNTLLTQAGTFSFPRTIPFMLSELATNGADLTIPVGAQATIDNSFDLGGITINGSLICPASGSFVLKATGITITGPGSSFICGTQSARFAGSLQISLKPGLVEMGSERNFLVSDGGTLRLSGQLKNTQWLRLAATANPGDKQITLPSAVAWSPGDQVVIGPTNYDYTEGELMTVASVTNGGKTVVFTAPLVHQHWGTVQTFQGSQTWSVDERAPVANLTRNIQIQGDGDESTMNYLGGHVMVMIGAYAYIDSVEFYHMGRMGEMARYPFHWHRAGDVTGQFIVNSSVHRSFQRCITVHGTNNSLVQNNVCYDHYGHGYFLEDGDETGNQIVGNLGILSKRPLPGRNLLQSDIDDSNADRFPGPATFWVSNPNNTVSNNFADGSQGSGFWMSFSQGINCVSEVCQFPDATHLANVFPALQPTAGFDNNVAQSTAVGMTWDGVDSGALTNNPNNPADRFLVITQYSPPTTPTFHGLHFFKNNMAATYVRSNTLNWVNAIFADNSVNIFFAYNQVVSNSAVIAMSNNHSTADYAYNKTFIGARVYDGPFDLRNIDFINFPSQPITYNGTEITPTPIYLYGGANRFTDAVQGLHFYPEPVRRIDFSPVFSPSIGWADAIQSTSIRDFDGSLAGLAGSVMVPNYPYNDDSSCVSVPGTDGLRCQYGTGVFIFLSILDNVPWQQTPFVVQRSDGPTTRSFADLKNYLWNLKFGVILGGKYDYQVNFPTDGSWTMPGKSSGGNWWPNSFQAIFQSFGTDALSPVVAFNGLGQACWVEGWPSVGSVEALRAATQNAYFYDPSTNLLYTKFEATQPSTSATSTYAHTSSENAMFNCAF